MRKTIPSAKRRKFKIEHFFSRQCLSADELAVFSSALRPCLRKLYAKDKWFFSSNFRKSAALAILGIAGVAISAQATPAYADNATLTLTVPKTLSVQLEPGKGMKSATGKISVESDAEYGYTLGLKAKESGGELKTTDNKTISSITTNTTSIPASGWGWRYGEWSGTTGDPNNKAFSASPTTTATPIADLTASTGGANKDYYLTIGANVDLNQPQGIYTKDFIITATAKPKNFTITYNTNGGSAVTAGSGATYTTKPTFTTSATIPTRTGYTFKGWCSASTTTKDCASPAVTCQANKACSVGLATGTSTINLYAMWENDLGINTMQEYGRLSTAEKTALRNKMTTDKEYVLKDERDQREYFLAKLADGNLWMTENLDLDLDAGKALKADETDISADWTPTRSTLTTTSGWTNDNNTPYSYDPGNRCWSGTITNNNYTISSSAAAKDCNKHDSSHWHVGNYYNWSAAVAMNSTTGYTTNLQDLNQSICPKGWRLPTYSGDKSFINLKNNANFTSGSSGTIHKTPYYFPYGGYFRGAASSYVGGYGYFWSSVVGSSNAAYRLYFVYDGGLLPQNIDDRYAGFSVRCVARTGDETPGPRTINNIVTMQEYGRLSDADKTAVKASMTQSQQYELKDERDNRMYYIAKLADGNIWMTENLDLDLSNSKTLTPNDTDISANWTPARDTMTPTSGTWTNDYNTPYSYDPGDRCWNGTIITGSTLPITNNTVAKDCSKHDATHYHIGNYYNFPAAIAMNNTSGYATDGLDVNQSICPKGWRLSTYEGDRSFKNLQSKAGFTAGPSGVIHKSPYYFTYGGGFYGGSDDVGSYGFFWSGIILSSTNAYRLYFDRAGLTTPQDNRSRGYGFSIRCVAR